MQAERDGRRGGTPAGLLIALGLFIGAGFGIANRQPSLGTIAGFAAGIVLAVLWTLIRRKGSA